MEDLCNICKKILPIASLLSDAYRSKGYRNKCKECLYIERGSRSRVGRPRKHFESVTEKKNFLDDVRNVPCLDCGGRFPPCAMDFDHLGRKNFAIMGKYRDKTIAELTAEISLCEIVCANCHRVRTQSRRV